MLLLASPYPHMQMRHYRVDSVQDVLGAEPEGQEIWVKVVANEPKVKERLFDSLLSLSLSPCLSTTSLVFLQQVSLSMKFVNQQTGEDLDAENLLIQAHFHYLFFVFPC